MKFHEHRLDASIEALFCRCPALCGFTVQHTDGILVSEVTIDPFADWPAPGELDWEIASALGQLLEEFPEAGELLRERTFARTFH